MIVSYNHDFCFVRIPKCGSTTCSVSIYDSGILEEDDICAEIEHSEGSETYRKPINWTVNERLLDLHLVHGGYYNDDVASVPQFVRHAPFHTMLRAGLVDEQMPCYAVMRNPLDRFFSIAEFIGTKHDVPKDINETWDKYYDGEDVFYQYSMMMRRPQHYWLGNENTVWNIEHLDYWLKSFIEERGGKYVARHDKKNDRYREHQWMTKDRQFQLLDLFEEDLVLWEESLIEASKHGSV